MLQVAQDQIRLESNVSVFHLLQLYRLLRPSLVFGQRRPIGEASKPADYHDGC